MVAIGVNEDGYREVIGCAEGFTKSAECWRDFPSWLKSRGLRGVRMFVGDKAAGMVGSIAEVFPGARYQRCTVRFCRNVLAKVPKSKRPRVAAMLKAIHAMESREASAAKTESMKPKEAAKVVREGFAETPAYCEMPASIGGASARTTPSSGSTGRSGGIPASSALSPMEGRR